MKLTNKIFFVLSAFVALNAAFAHADIYSGLSPDDQAKIDHDQQVFPEPQDVAGSVWPRVVVYQRVNAPTEQAAAVMFDFDLHKVMFGPLYKDGKVTKSGIAESSPVSPASANTNISYTMVLQSVLGLTLPDEKYVVNDVMSTYATDSYSLTWTMVSALSMKDTQGSVKFEPLANGYTLIAYTNFISPPRPPVAKFIKSIYIQMVKDTVSSLVGQITNERNSDQAKLEAQVANLKQALRK
jgi:hypothetical protein